MKIIPLVITAFLGYSCAAKKLTAQNADLLIEHQIQKRLPLYSDQKDELSQDTNKFLNQQKPFIQEIVPVVSNVELNVAKIDDQYDRLIGLYKKLSVNFSALMSKYMAMLDQKQQKEFDQNLKEENKKLAKDDQEDQLEKLEERFKTLFGSMSASQKEIVVKNKAYFKERHYLRIKRREILHSRFAEIYKMELSKEARAKYFLEAFSNYQNGYPENPKNKEIIKDIILTLTADQKKNFKEKLQDLKEILGYYLEADF